MYAYALKMLVGDKIKYISIVLGLTFASFIITQQAAILVGIVDRTFGFVTDTSQPNIWVMDPSVQYIADIKPMKETDLWRVRSVANLEWAMPLFYGTIQARMHNGIFQTCILIGIDDASLIGGPPIMLEGKLEDLRLPDAIIVDKVGSQTKMAHYTKSGAFEPLQVGDVMELNDRRAYVAGISQVSRTFQSQPVLYTTYHRATSFVPSTRDELSFVIARAKPGLDPEEVCRQISMQTGLKAMTADQLKNLTLFYYMKYTGIFVNFGVAIVLGFIIGTAIAGQTLYNFTVDNLPYFAVFKAMGADNKMLRNIIFLQAFFVSIIGWGLGMGLCSLFGLITEGSELSFKLPLYLYTLSLLSILSICLFAALISMRRVATLDPAIVFKA